MRCLAVVTAAALLLAAAAQAAEAPATNQPKASPRWKDTELKKAIEERFARSAIAPNRFRVDVNDGVARITGKTEVLQHKGVATRLARSMGARQVQNEIEVSEAARQRATAHLRRERKPSGQPSGATPRAAPPVGRGQTR